jgi:gliding motility-associated-like protein
LYDTICFSSFPFPLDSLILPLTGDVSGPGVGANRYFYPELAGEGTHTLTLSAGSGSCLIQIQKNIEIIGESDVTFGDLPNFCQNDPKLLLESGLPQGGFYYLDGEEEEYLDPSLLPVGNQIVKYVFVGDDGCSIVKSQTVFIKSIPERPDLIVNGDSATCTGDTLELGASFFAPRYIWSTGDTTQYINAFNQGFYYVSINASNGCRNYSDTLFLGFYPLPVTELFSPIWPNGYNVSAPNAGDGSIYLDIQGGAPPYTIEWSNGATTEDLSGLNSGLYLVTLTDTGGCVARDSIFLSDPVNTSIGSIMAEGEFSGIKIPNGFTPNGDGFNDTWKIDGLSPALERNEVLVFDARGMLAYRMQNYRAQWDGRDVNGTVLPDGDYFWVFKAANGAMKGSVNLRR